MSKIRANQRGAKLLFLGVRQMAHRGAQKSQMEGREAAPLGGQSWHHDDVVGGCEEPLGEPREAGDCGGQGISHSCTHPIRNVQLFSLQRETEAQRGAGLAPANTGRGGRGRV